MIKLIYVLLIILFLNNCSQKTPAPVVYKITPILNELLKKEKDEYILNNKNKPQTKPSKNIYIVKKGDTLKNISEKLNVSIKDLLKLNNLNNPNKIYIKQKLTLPANKKNLQNSKIKKNIKLRTNSFIWPVKGKLINHFGKDKKGFVNDGINISTRLGEKIVAVESGEVIFVGKNIRGFGNLLMIRHNGGWISAYAHNSKIIVKKGDKVSKGDKIANSGSSGLVKQPQLHFELRKGIKPINPIKYLPPLA